MNKTDTAIDTAFRLCFPPYATERYVQDESGIVLSAAAISDAFKQRRDAKMPLDLGAYYEQLDRHDWYYNFSDDGYVWRRGVDEEDRLKALAKYGGPDFEALYQGFHKHYFSGPSWSTEQAAKPEHPQPAMRA